MVEHTAPAEERRMVARKVFGWWGYIGNLEFHSDMFDDGIDLAVNNQHLHADSQLVDPEVLEVAELGC